MQEYVKDSKYVKVLEDLSSTYTRLLVLAISSNKSFHMRTYNI